MNIRSLMRTAVDEFRGYWTGPFSLNNPNTPLSAFWGDGVRTNAGVGVSEETALRYSAVWSAVTQISQTIGSLPLGLYRKRTTNGIEDGREAFTDHPIHRLLQYPNPETSSMVFRETLQAHLLLWGNAYAEIVWNGAGQPQELWQLHPSRVMPFRDNIGDGRYGRIRYRVDRNQIIEAEDMLHIPGFSGDGTVGYSVIGQARQNLGLGLAAEQFGASFFGNGSLFGGILTHPGKLNKETKQGIRESIVKNHQGPDKANDFIILGEGMTYNRIGIPPNEAQFIECVVPGTLITMADGTRRQAEMLRAGDVVVGWDNGPIKATVAAVGRPPDKVLVRVSTARGRVITTSFDHPFLAKRALRTVGGRPDVSEPEWIAAGKLAAGAYVRVALGVPAGMVCRPVAEHEAYFLGAMIGDGYIRSGGCSFAAADAGVVEAMTISTRSMGGDLRRRGAYDYDIKTGGVGRGGSAIRTLLNESGTVGTHAHTKRVPEMVMTAGPEGWRDFLSGYLDTDGCVVVKARQQPKVYFGSVSRDLLDDCQALLAYLGVNSSIFSIGSGGPREVCGQMCETRPSWALYVTGTESLRSLAEQLRSRHSEKSVALRSFLSLTRTQYRELNWQYDRVTDVEYAGCGETVGIEIEGCHTHITAGLVTHNTRKFGINDVARWFNMPLHMLKDLERATYSNIEQQGIDFGMYTIRPWCIRWEKELERKLIAASESNIQYVRHTMDAVLRGDIQTRYTAYGIGRDKGWLSADEIRAMEEMNPQPNGQGKLYLVQSAQVPVNLLADLTQSQIDKNTTPPQAPQAPTQPNSNAARSEEIAALREEIGTLRQSVAEHRSAVDALANAAEERASVPDTLRRQVDDHLAIIRGQEQEIATKQSLILLLTERSEHAEQERDVQSVQRVEAITRAELAEAQIATAEAQVHQLRETVGTAQSALEVAVARADNAERLVGDAEAVQTSAVARAEAAEQQATTTAIALAAAEATAEMARAELANVATLLTDTQADVAAQAELRDGAVVALRQAEADAESARTLAETARQEAEQAQADARVSAEKLTAAELLVTAATTARSVAEAAAATALEATEAAEAVAEQARLEAEQAKQNAEEGRAEALTAKQATKSADERRLIAEDAQRQAEAAASAATQTAASVAEQASLEVLQAQTQAETERAQAEAARQARDAADARCLVAQEDCHGAQEAVAAQRQATAERDARVVGAIRALFVDSMGRMVRRETEKARRNLGTPAKLRAWAEGFYLLHGDTCVEALRPAVSAHLAWMGSEADVDATTRDLVVPHLKTAEQQIRAIADGDPDDYHVALERLLTKWETDRPNALADVILRKEITHVRTL